MTIRRYLTALIIATVGVLNVVAALADATDWGGGQNEWVTPTVIVDPGMPLCATEDSVSCIWVGPVQGNGHGAIVINGPEAGTP